MTNRDRQHACYRAGECDGSRTGSPDRLTRRCREVDPVVAGVATVRGIRNDDRPGYRRPQAGRDQNLEEHLVFPLSTDTNVLDRASLGKGVARASYPRPLR